MNKLLIALLLLLGSASAQTPAPSAPQDETAQKGRALLNQAIAALGGPAYLNVKDMSQQGRSYSFYHGEARGVGILFWLFWKAPQMERVELTKQRDVIYIYNAGQGYETTFRGTRPIEQKDLDDYLRQRDYSLANVLRDWVNQPGAVVFYEGPAFAGNAATDQVSIINSKNQSVKLFLDANTHLPVKKSFTVRDPESRERDLEEELYGNYHLVQGVQTPFDSSRLHNGEVTRQRYVNQVRYNTGLADSLFTATVTYDPNAKKK